MSSKAQRELEIRKAKKEIITRGDSEKGLLFYIDWIFDFGHKRSFRREWWHSLMARALMDIYMGVNDRLIISMPPRMGKTEMSVRQFASYVQGLEPTLKVQYATYGATLSEVVSSECKNYLESAAFKELFDVEFDNKLNTKSHWRLKSGGGFQGTSVDGSATGMGSEIYILDDLHKAGEADSKAKRDAVYSFYNTSVLTRLEGRKAVILIMQRLHEDDLVGRLIEQDGLVEDGGIWEILELPIINDLESFEAFYNWIEKIDGAKDVVSPQELEEIKAEANKRLLLDIEVFKNQQRVFKRSLFEQFKKKREDFRFYEVAREVYLKSHRLEPTIVRYRDVEVVREPLTPLDSQEYGLDFIVKLYKGIAKREFVRQYMQDAQESEAGFFNKEDFTYIGDGDMPEHLNKYILIDDAESQENTADDRGVVVVGKTIDDGIITTVVLDGANGKWDVYGTSEQIINLMIKFPDAPVFIEGAGGGITLGVVLKREIAKYNAKAQASGKPQIKNWVKVYKPDNKVSKNEVIKLMANPLEIHTLLFYKFMDSGFKAQLEFELKKFNPEKKSNTDNVIDPLAKSFFLEECVPKNKPKPKPIVTKRRVGGFGAGGGWRGV